jgi:hypothetical protein
MSRSPVLIHDCAAYQAKGPRDMPSKRLKIGTIIYLRIPLATGETTNASSFKLEILEYW